MRVAEGDVSIAIMMDPVLIDSQEASDRPLALDVKGNRNSSPGTKGRESRSKQSGFANEVLFY